MARAATPICLVGIGRPFGGIPIFAQHAPSLDRVARCVAAAADIASTRNIEELLAPTPYRAIGILGRGGMSEVYVVEHQVLGRRFALKLLHSRYASEPQLVDRARVEAQALARLHHPNVVTVVDFWVSDGGKPCIVMELLRGHTLEREMITRPRLPPAEAVAIVLQALSALEAAHRIGIVHRDVKPENLFLHDVLEYGVVVKVLDFGLARIVEGASRAPAALALPTDTGHIVGSPRFMSPEAARAGRVDHRSDLYSMGLVLYLLLAGHGPFDAGSSVLRGPSAYAGPVVSHELDAAVVRALRERPEERYESAQEFATALERAISPSLPSAR